MSIRHSYMVFVATALSLATVQAKGDEPVAPADWVQLSNVHARSVLEMLAKYDPEGAGRYGLDGCNLLGAREVRGFLT